MSPAASSHAAFLLSPSQTRYQAFKAVLPSIGLPSVRWLDVRQSDAANEGRLGSASAPAAHRHHRAVLLAHAYAVELARAEGASTALIFEDDARTSTCDYPIKMQRLAQALQMLTQSTQPLVLRLGYNPWPRDAAGQQLTSCGCNLSYIADVRGLVRATAGCNLRGAAAWAINRAAFLPFLRRVNRTSATARDSIDLTIARRFDNLLLTPPLFFQEQGRKTADHSRNYCSFRGRCGLPAVSAVLSDSWQRTMCIDTSHTQTPAC